LTNLNDVPPNGNEQGELESGIEHKNFDVQPEALFRKRGLSFSELV
jgi:hypothetical protein